MLWPARCGAAAAGLVLLAALVLVATSPRPGSSTVLVETRAELERQVSVLKAQLRGKAAASAHPHPRVRGGVFSKTMTQLAGAIQALAGAPSPAAADSGSLREALRSGAAPARHKAVKAAAHRAGSLVKVLEESESHDLAKAQKIEHEIDRLKSRRQGSHAETLLDKKRLATTITTAKRLANSVSITINNYEGGSSPDGKHRAHRSELEKLASEERRAGEQLTSLRLKQDEHDTKNRMMMLKTENCSLAQQFDKNLTTLPLIDSEEICSLPNVWDEENEECVQSPLGDEGDQPVDCMIKGPQSCICRNWAEAHMWKVDSYRKLLRDNFEFRYEAEYGKLTPSGTYSISC
jgi:hypothetical protein